MNSQITDISGQRFNHWTVLRYDEQKHNRPGSFWICQCDCGTIRSVYGNSLRNGKSTSCGCATPHPASKFREDLTGQRFGRLVGIEFDHSDEKHVTWWKFKCDCGNVCVKRARDVKRGRIKSCGCMFDENLTSIGERTKTHGESETRLYHIYQGMIDRCYREKRDKYPQYGGRGIRVCSEWYNPDIKGWDKRKLGNPGFEAFRKWAYNNGYYDQPKDTPYANILSIERIDVNGNYCPENCMWIPMWKQSENKKNTRWIFDGEEYLPFTTFDHKYNLTSNFARNRIVLDGWPVSTVVYAARNPELGIRYYDGAFRDKDGFIRLIPRIKNQ